MEFWRYYRVFRRWRWLILATVLAAMAIGVAVSPRPGTEYEATVTLSAPSEQRSLFLISGLPAEPGPVREALALNLIRSRDLAERVIKRLALDIRPEELQRRLSVTKDQGTGRIRVSVTGRTPQEAATLANVVAETAVAYDQEIQSRAGTLAREFAEKQVESARANLRKAEDVLLAFRQKNDFELSSSKGAQVAALRAEDQSVALSFSQIEARLSSNRAQMDQQSATRTDRELSDNPIARELRGQLVGLEVSLTSELALHTEKYPSVVALKAKIQAVKDRLNTELTKIVSKEQVQFNPIYDTLVKDRISLETEKVALLAKREALLRALAQARKEVPRLEQIQLEQSRLNRNIEILSREYADLQGRLAQARLKEQEAQDLGSLAVASPARAASHPTSFRNQLARLAFATILGLTGGAGLAFSLEYLDNTLKTPANAERLLGLPALAVIPRHNPPFDEAYRLLRANLAMRGHKQKADVIALTSPKPREGTSTVVANLARAFAQAGRRTIVVDASPQRPTQHVHFGIPLGKGLVEVLAGEATHEEALVQTAVPNLWVLPSGSIPHDGAGFLGSRKMAELLADLKQRGDVILIDTPPAGAFADAFAVASLASGVLLVLDARQVPRGVEEQVKAQLDRLGAKVLGLVLTNVRPDLVDSYVYQERFYRGSLAENGRR